MLAVVLLAAVALAVAQVALIDTFRREAADNFRTLVIILEVILVALLSFAAASYLRAVARERSRHAVIESLAEAFSVPRSIEEIAQISVARLVGSDVGTAALLAVTKEDGQQLEPVAACGYPPHWRIDSRYAGGLVPQEVVVRQQLEVTDPWIEPVAERAGPRPWVARVPIVSGEEVLGLLLLVHRSPGLLGDVRLLRMVSTLIAAALDHAQLYEAAYAPSTSTEEANLARHDLLGAVAGELGPALVALEARASVVAGRQDSPGTIEDARRLSALSQSLGRLQDMLQDLVDLGRTGEPPAGAPVPSRASTDIAPALRAALDALAPAFEARRQTVQFELPDEPVMAIVSAGAVERLTLHLLSNANRSAPEEGSIVVRASDHGDTSRIEVEDSGPSVDALERNHIFEPFYRVTAGVPEVPGAGLGLAVVRQLAESQGGNVWAESRAGGGTSYYVDLPALVRTAEGPVPPSEAAPASTEAPLALNVAEASEPEPSGTATEAPDAVGPGEPVEEMDEDAGLVSDEAEMSDQPVSDVDGTSTSEAGDEGLEADASAPQESAPNGEAPPDLDDARADVLREADAPGSLREDAESSESNHEFLP